MIFSTAQHNYMAHLSMQLQMYTETEEEREKDRCSNTAGDTHLSHQSIISIKCMSNSATNTEASSFVGIKLEQLIQAMEISISNWISLRVEKEWESDREREWKSERAHLIIGVVNALKQTNIECITLQLLPKSYPLICSIFKMYGATSVNLIEPIYIRRQFLLYFFTLLNFNSLEFLHFPITTHS